MRAAFSISGHRPADQALAIARTAEAAGMAQVWVTEDYCERGAFALAGAIGAVTSRIQIGIGVVNPFTRHPMLTAMEHAALDELSGGRAILGLGTSNRRWIEEWLGIPFDRPIGRLRDAIEVIRAALAGKPVHVDGPTLSVNTKLAFAPRRTNPPLWLGAKGPGMLALGGRTADGVLLSVLSSSPYVAWARRQIDNPDTEVGAYLSYACSDDGDAARDSVRDHVAFFLGVHGEHDITRVAGVPAEMAAQFREGWRTGTPRVDLVTDEMVDTFAVAGTPDQCASGLRRFAAAGLDIAVLRDDGHSDPTALIHSMLDSLAASGS